MSTSALPDRGIRRGPTYAIAPTIATRTTPCGPSTSLAKIWIVRASPPRAYQRAA
ncbi:MAG TPA: hypothetical protein VLT33_07970 [Labilithrix sp.]|nr:hypothetical protein [Labilithrix sp.]